MLISPLGVTRPLGTSHCTSDPRLKKCPNLKSSQGALSLRCPPWASGLVRGPLARLGSGRFLGANLLAEPRAEPLCPPMVMRRFAQDCAGPRRSAHSHGVWVPCGTSQTYWSARLASSGKWYPAGVVRASSSVTPTCFLRAFGCAARRAWPMSSPQHTLRHGDSATTSSMRNCSNVATPNSALGARDGAWDGLRGSVLRLGRHCCG